MKVDGGIKEAAKVFPGHEPIMVIIGLIKGNGSGFMRPLARGVCGKWDLTSNELLNPSVVSKQCLVAAVILVAKLNG